MLEFQDKYAGNSHSQNGEDFILQEVLGRLVLATGHAVEVGGNDGRWLSNIRNLIEQGWVGTFVEANYGLHCQSVQNWKGNPRVKSICSKVNGQNVNAFVKDCEVFSTDTDGADYEIFKGLKSKPKIVIVEIDSSIPPDSYEFNSDGGAGYRPMTELGIEKGYFLLCHTGNLILIDAEYRGLFPEIVGDGLTNADEYFNRGWM
jgi:hypothetical protein